MKIVLVEEVRRVSVSLDAAERPCVDCEVGEPHCCPLLRSTVRGVLTP